MRAPALLLCVVGAAGCDAAISGGAAVVLGFGALTVSLGAWRYRIGPGRFDRRSRLLTAAARQADLPFPSGDQTMQVSLPCGLPATLSAPEHLELQVALPDRLPPGVGVDRPGLPPGHVLERVSVPAADWASFMAYGPAAETLSILTRPVRRALEAERRAALHVAVERGALLVRLGPEDADLTPDAIAALDRVARAVVRTAAAPAQRLLEIVRDDEPGMRVAALRALLRRFPESPEAAEAAERARSDHLDDAILRSWAGRRSGGALSLAAQDAPWGGLAMTDVTGRVSKAEG